MQQTGLLETPVLVGRSEQLRRFEQALDQQKPALILLSGPLAAGKTKLLAAFERIAGGRNWRAARVDDRGPLALTPTIGRTQFADRVRALLQITQPPSVPQPSAPKGHRVLRESGDSGVHNVLGGEGART